MDILSHGLWAAATAKGAKRAPRLGSGNIKVGRAFFWGMFPDLFAFTIPFVILFWTILTGPMTLGDWPRPERGEPPSGNAWSGFTLAFTLYQYSHSLVIFVAVITIIYAICRYRGARFPWELFGWPLHILMDIPTHTYEFFPTPLFWPISQWKFSGYSWAHPMILIPNYILLVLVFIFLKKRSTVIPAPEPESINDRGSRIKSGMTK